MKKWFLLFLLLGTPNAWATYPNYTVCPSTCDFNTLQGAVADLIANHATPASPVTITISGSWASADTAAVNITTGLTTTSSNTLTISTTGTARNNGVFPSGSGGYWLAPTAAVGITVSAGYITINGLAIDATTSGDDAISVANYYPNLTFINNFFKVTAGYAMDTPSLRGTNYFYNNICVGNNSALYNACVGTTNQDSGTSTYVYNNTSYGMGQSFNANTGATGIYVLANNVASSSITDSIYRGQFASSGSNNVCDLASECTISPLTNGTNSATSYTSYYTSPSGNNFSLKVGSILIAGGTSESGTFTTDITGATRSTWDVGAFAYNATVSAPPSKTIINNAIIRNATIN